MLLTNEKRVHFVGVGGVGMSALAKVLLEAGHEVSGSDLNESEYTIGLRQAGATIFTGHKAEQVDNAGLVVISSAVPTTNPELQQARALGLRVIKRAELLGELTRQFKSIAVAGTHGKTTTSSLVGFVLEHAGLDPILLIGGKIANLGTNAKMGQGPYLVAEADEFDGSFLRLSPWIAVITNVEADHLDFYADLDAIQHAFTKFIASTNPGGEILVCADDPVMAQLVTASGRQATTYGLITPADWQATNIKTNKVGGNTFSVQYEGQDIGTFSTRLPGRHNVQNALAAIAIATKVGVNRGKIAEALDLFSGAKRRFEVCGDVGGITVVDDYAHHPTEIKATLAAAREQHAGRIWCVFQPHTYNRTKELWGEFLSAFGDADRVVICDVYSPAGRENDTWGITSEKLVQAIAHPGVSYGGNLANATHLVCNEARPGDLILTMGAGTITEMAGKLLNCLRTSYEGKNDAQR